MPGKVPAGDETVLYALPEDQPDSLSEGHKSKQADVDLSHGMTVVKEEDAVVSAEQPKKAAPRKSSR